MIRHVPSPESPGPAYPVAGAPLSRGNEAFERARRRDTLARGRIGVYSGRTGEALLATVALDNLMQAYFWGGNDGTSIEYMTRPATLPGGQWVDLESCLELRTRTDEAGVRAWVTQ